MKKERNETTTISFDEFIDIITDGKGEEIKEELKKLEFQNKQRSHK